MVTASGRSNYVAAYWLRSNIPGLSAQAMLDQVYDVQIPGLEGRLEEVVNGAIAGRMDWRGFQTARMRDAEFKCKTFFPGLFAYIGVPTIGNADDGDKVGFEFTMAYNRGVPSPNVDLDAVKVNITECYIKGIPQGVIAAADGGEYTPQLYCESWTVEYKGKPLIEWDGVSESVKTYLPGPDGTPGSVAVDHGANLRKALGLT